MLIAPEIGVSGRNMPKKKSAWKVILSTGHSALIEVVQTHLADEKKQVKTGL